MVDGVETAGAAKKAELEPGDIIVAFAGSPVSGGDDIHSLLTADRIGISTPLKVLRQLELLTLEVVPQEGQS
ncbi:MAG TPA: PDZ domain-containing protein [Opitutaceae bacterium]|jgi:S1-C subfamily serine protease